MILCFIILPFRFSLPWVAGIPRWVFRDGHESSEQDQS